MRPKPSWNGVTESLKIDFEYIVNFHHQTFGDAFEIPDSFFVVSGFGVRGKKMLEKMMKVTSVA